MAAGHPKANTSASEEQSAPRDVADPLAEWLAEFGLDAYYDVLVENDVGLDVVAELTEDDLKEMGFPIGARRRLLKVRASLVVPTSPEDPRSVVGEEGSDLTSAHPDEGSEPEGPVLASSPERRQLTVLFCDLVGSTALSTRHDPELLSELLRAFHGACSKEVERFGGYVARYMGDGVLVYFGYPAAQENDAERAIRAGLALVDAVARLVSLDGAPAACRVGIATGAVMAGERVGEGESAEHTVVGETPNLAHRMQGLAQPGQVVVGPLTWRLAGARFDGVSLEPRPLKGIDAPVRAWQVVGARSLNVWFEGTAFSSLVGREEELALLERRWGQACSGSGQAVLLTGEAGVGKSRVVRELLGRLDDATQAWLAQCAPLNRNDAFHPLREYLCSAIGIGGNVVEEVAMSPLDALVAHVEHHRLSDEVATGLATVLRIPTQGRFPPLLLEAGALHRRVVALLGEYLQERSRTAPCLLVVEDLHWADDATKDVLTEWVRCVRSAPVLLVFTARPQWEDPWADEVGITGLSLNQLTAEQSTRLIGSVVGEHAFTPAVVAQIVARTDGIPLFVEEVARTVAEAGLDEVVVPATLRDSLAARLDRLSLGKPTAQWASVIGRQFSRELLLDISGGREDEAQRGLEELVRAGLVYLEPGGRATLSSTRWCEMRPMNPFSYVIASGCIGR